MPRCLEAEISQDGNGPLTLGMLTLGKIVSISIRLIVDSCYRYSRSPSFQRTTRYLWCVLVTRTRSISEIYSTQTLLTRTRIFDLNLYILSSSRSRGDYLRFTYNVTIVPRLCEIVYLAIAYDYDTFNRMSTPLLAADVLFVSSLVLLSAV